MRLWSLHPSQLDRAALIAAWREGLFAQKVLLGETKGYKNHPQLARFKNSPEPIKSIGYYLYQLAEEAKKRGYKFDVNKIISTVPVTKLEVNDSQLVFEWQHLLKKVMIRNPQQYAAIFAQAPLPHPLFTIKNGPIEYWEKQ